jgi:8-oxo-dGTP diphosphatase
MLVVAALVRRGDAVLLVCQQGPDDSQAYWSLPGGVVEPGELLTAALARELREEASLDLLDPGRVLYTVQTTDSRESWLAVVFETYACLGEPACSDPDGRVKAAEFVDCPTALERLSDLPWRNMREPIMAYLHGSAQSGAVWIYRRVGEDVVLAACIK